ncbi:MAG: non-homologous end-joining DNA ligase [Gemmatimonadaceae bacterium]
MSAVKRSTAKKSNAKGPAAKKVVSKKSNEKESAVSSHKVASAKDSATVSGVVITHANREVYPDVPITKGELAEYFELVAPLMLAHIKGRPISCVRCPEGRAQACFFQKHWPPKGGAPVTTKLVTEGSGEPLPYAFASTARDLVALVQHGVMEAHVWGSQYANLDKPDRLVLDLDPGPGVSWLTIKKAAVQTRELLLDLGLESWMKLTGGKGIHVVVPIDRRVEWDVVNAFAKAIALKLTSDSPQLYVAKASKAIRDRKIYVDWQRNSRGATWVAPWSPRSRDNAPVSMPLPWDALSDVKKPDMYTIPVVTKIMAKSYADPWKEMLTYKQRLTAAMAVKLG